MRVLGIDFGARRVGLALSDPSGRLARPWRAVARRDGDDAALAADLAREIATLAADEDGLAAVVVGRPARLDGSPTEMTVRVEAFADALGALVRVPVALADERLSSHEAEARLAERERDWRKRKAKLDAAAAAVILQDYLDRSPAPAAPLPAGGDLA
jgi:putative Holliday junction resolvase